MKKTKKPAQLVRSDQRLLLLGLFAAALLIMLFLMFSENPMVPVTL
jgi:hypothetical protein